MVFAAVAVEQVDSLFMSPIMFFVGKEATQEQLENIFSDAKRNAMTRTKSQ